MDVERRSPGDTTADDIGLDRRALAELDDLEHGDRHVVDAARNLDRLQADLKLVQRLMWSGYTGPDWETFVETLAAYGVAVLRAWIDDGRIYARCKEKGRHLRVCAAQRRREDALSLAGETVALAIPNFREHVLVPGRWDPAKGASLRTYFVGQCLLRFPNIYRRWLGDHDRNRASPLLDGVGEQLDAHRTRRAESEAFLQLDAAAMLARVPDPVTRTIVQLRGAGYGWSEVSSVTGLSMPAAKSRLSRLKDHWTEETA